MEERELKEMDVCGIRKVTHLVVVLPIKRTVKLCAAVSTGTHRQLSLPTSLADLLPWLT